MNVKKLLNNIFVISSKTSLQRGIRAMKSTTSQDYDLQHFLVAVFAVTSQLSSYRLGSWIHL